MAKKQGRAGENTKSARLATLLRSKGYPDADFEKQFTILDPISKKQTIRKPDVVFSNGGTHLISAKDGENLEREAIASAIQYLRDLSKVTNVGEVFAVTYPKKGENYHLHILPSIKNIEISLVLDSMEEVAEIIDQTVKGRISEIESKQEPVHYEMGRILRYSSIELSQVIKGVPEEDLEEIFGGHDFFHSALESLLKEKEKSSALHLGVAYLFINQILFYILLSNTAKMQGTPEIYPEIKNEDKNSPIKLRDNYFLKVRLKDYEPIYGPDVAQHFDEDTVGNFLIQLIDMLIELSPKLTVPDLVGQIFQNLIPFKIRKPLGAHFTNPKTAQLLAHLSIDDSDTTVLDPACGSGTLLVAAYKRKMELSPTDNLSRLHKRFIENEITGIDAMAFSSHLAAVNLALQQPLTDTDFVRIGRSDSTKLKPGDIIEPTGGSMPDAFLQTQLTGKASKKTKSQSRVPSMKAGKLRSIQLSKVNLVIMNPPFTSQNNLSKEYRILLKRRFVYPSIYKKIIFWKTSQQVYFLLLADKFLNKNGNIAAVLPFTTFTGHAFFPLINYYALWIISKTYR